MKCLCTACMKWERATCLYLLHECAPVVESALPLGDTSDWKWCCVFPQEAWDPGTYQWCRLGTNGEHWEAMFTVRIRGACVFPKNM